jgi:endonuclease-3
MQLDGDARPRYRLRMPVTVVSAKKSARTEEKQQPKASDKKRPAARPRSKSTAESEKARISAILDTLDRLYPDAHCELANWQTPLQLLVAVMLSAQCTDDRVNQVTPALFGRYPDAKAFATADPAELEELVRSINFYRNKAKHIRAACKIIVEKYGGEVPRTMAELIALPGVARKTANVVLGTAYGIPSGVVVDTHIARLSQRLSMTTHDEPVKIEADLMKLWPEERWIMSGHRLIWHGRRVCQARRPDCDSCALHPYCPSAELGGELPRKGKAAR